ncbi:MAG TPA: radical SAM protein [Nitrososphaeria archaeon]|nr:radical SAM protein [Nitrososphaeria archaeon]
MSPQAAIWIMSGECNLRCIHCYASRFLGADELTLEEKLKLIRELAECGVSYVGLTGGEPLINEDLEPCLRELYDYGIEYSVNTNATLMSEEKAELLERYDAYLFVSIDGARKETHEKMRGIGTWRRLMRGLDLIRKRSLPFSTIMAVSSLNYMEAEDYVELAESLGAEAACMIPTMPVGRARSEIIPRVDELVHALRSAESAAKKLGYWISVWCYVPAKLIIDPRFVSTWADCRRGKVVDIDPAGNLLLCDVLDLKFSNVRKGFRAAFREYLEAGEVKEVMAPRLKEPCSSCELKEICMGGCYARSYLTYGAFDGPDPYCPKTQLAREVSTEHHI